MPANNIYTEPIGEQPEFSDSDLEKIRKHQASKIHGSGLPKCNLCGLPIKNNRCEVCGTEFKEQ